MIQFSKSCQHLCYLCQTHAGIFSRQTAACTYLYTLASYGVWQYGLWSFKPGDTKLDRYLAEIVQENFTDIF